MSFFAVGENFQSGFATDNSWLSVLFLQFPIALAPAMFTWMIPGLLGYRRGGMASIGAMFSLVFLILLPGKELFGAYPQWYSRLHPWLFGVFYVYALAGLALCAVGLFDRKRSAVWALLAMLAMITGATWDTVVWFGFASSAPMVPWGFIGFWILLAIGFVRRSADAPPSRDLMQAAQIMANNRTRRSRSIPRKLLREGNIHLLPIYYLMNLSTLGHEGIANSGSFRFADHIYVSEPSGRGKLGFWIDRKLLQLPATAAFRLRYKRAQEEMRRALEGLPKDLAPVRILAIPCGLPRDIAELAQSLDRDNSELLHRVEYVGMDVDPELLSKAEAFLKGCPLAATRFHMANALLREQYPQQPFHVIVSTGLGEFLDDDDLLTFYENVYAALAPGGTFFTSATREEKRSEALLRAFELDTSYRTPSQLERILQRQGWTRLKLVQDDSGLQTFVVAVK